MNLEGADDATTAEYVVCGASTRDAQSSVKTGGSCSDRHHTVYRTRLVELRSSIPFHSLHCAAHCAAHRRRGAHGAVQSSSARAQSRAERVCRALGLGWTRLPAFPIPRRFVPPGPPPLVPSPCGGTAGPAAAALPRWVLEQIGAVVESWGPAARDPARGPARPKARKARKRERREAAPCGFLARRSKGMSAHVCNAAAARRAPLFRAPPGAGTASRRQRSPPALSRRVFAQPAPKPSPP